MSAALPRLLEGIASDDEARTVLAGMPCNATIEMDLALWRVAERATPYREVLLDTPPDELAAAHLAGELPDFALSAFLNRYGSRVAGEVDVGVPRWSEDPTPVPAMPANHLRVTDPQQAPDRRFERAAAQAEAKVAELAQRARRNRRVRGRIAGFFLRRARELSGLREAGEFVGPYALRDRCRRLLLIGAQLQGNRLPDRADDVVFLTMPELRTAVERADDLREVVEGRRPDHVRELRRRSVRSPCCPTAPRWRRCRRPERRATARSPAWERHPGRVRGRARIVRDPASATIEPGEILIAPTTDPGWTPLFLTAGGLVTETGAVMAHGPTVAREYGIPSVICVPGATERIRSGQLVSVDGAAGTVTIEQPTWTVRRMPMSGATSGHRSRLLRPSSPRGLRVTDLGRGKRHDRRVPQRRIAQDVAADELLARDPLALLIGMLDQHRTATASG